VQGVLEFYKQLEIGADDELGIWGEGRLGNLVCIPVLLVAFCGFSLGKRSCFTSECEFVG
jgi:hypothetical protein